MKLGHSWKNELFKADFILHTKIKETATAAQNLYWTWFEPSQTFLSLRMLLIDVKGGAHGSQKSKKDGHSWKNELSRADFILHTKAMQIATARVSR